MGKFIDLTGKRFENWVVLGCAGHKGENLIWQCACDCGSERVVDGRELRRGGSKSCGCNANVTHGLTRKGKHHPLYSTWMCMKRRCLNPKAISYKNYGGRGIAICERWLDSFVDFLIDMGERPTHKHSIERIDNNGNYYPENCRWATKAEQNRNSRVNRMLSFNGRTMCLVDWAREVNIPQSTLHARIKAGWPFGEALGKRIRKRGYYI